MTSEKKLNANRENAKKSTGPRTSGGKSRASKNALKHGLLAQDAVLPGEDPADFDRHLVALEETYLPRNRVEKEIVRQIADARWRMQRLSRIETAVITAGMENTRRFDNDTGPYPDDRPAQTRILGRAMLTRTKLLNNLARYDGHLGRRFYRAVELMIDIRREERKDREEREAREAQENYNIDPRPGRYVPTQAPSSRPSAPRRGVGSTLTSVDHPQPAPIAVRENADRAPRHNIGFRPAGPPNEKPRNEPNNQDNCRFSNELGLSLSAPTNSTEKHIEPLNHKNRLPRSHALLGSGKNSRGGDMK